MNKCPYCNEKMCDAPRDSKSQGYEYCVDCRRWVSPAEYRRIPKEGQ